MTPSTNAQKLLEGWQRGNVLAADCPSRPLLAHVTSRWGTLVMIVLLTGTFRFSDLRRRIPGISERMLAQTLQQLEADGFVLRTAFQVVPPHVEYSLTAPGQEAAAHVAALANWIEDNLTRLKPPAARGTDPETAKA
jgi:DNA-binding HxlR family transcriptional regulator